MQEYYPDSICQVLANDSSEKTVFNVLNQFLPGYEELSLDYVEHPGGITFQNEKELISYYIENRVPQMFLWHLNKDNPEKLMIGADILSDGKLVINLTLASTLERVEEYFSQLKSFLKSEIGVVTHVVLAEYKDGADFKRKYGELAS